MIQPATAQLLASSYSNLMLTNASTKTMKSSSLARMSNECVGILTLNAALILKNNLSPFANVIQHN